MKKKVRKPKPITVGVNLDGLPYTLTINVDDIKPKHCRKFATWLLKAASFQESKKK